MHHHRSSAQNSRWPKELWCGLYCWSPAGEWVRVAVRAAVDCERYVNQIIFGRHFFRRGCSLHGLSKKISGVPTTRTSPILSNPITAVQRRDNYFCKDNTTHTSFRSNTIADCTTIERKYARPASPRRSPHARHHLLSDSVFVVRLFVLGEGHPARARVACC